jgi:hypothetical protein
MCILIREAKEGLLEIRGGFTDMKTGGAGGQVLTFVMEKANWL